MTSRSRCTGLADSFGEAQAEHVSITVHRAPASLKLKAAALFNSNNLDIYLDYSR